MKPLTELEAAAILREQDHFLILTHRRPDGDTTGCAAALCRGLRALGKDAAILQNPQFTARYLPYLDGLTVDAAPEGAILVSVDVAAETMFPMNVPDVPVSLLIDHHGSNTRFAAQGLVEPDRAACGEIIFALLQALSVPVTKEIAEPLYVAVSTDTGCFRYSNTTSNTLRVAAALKDCGADAFSINKALFETKRFARLKLEAYLTEHLQLLGGGVLCICTLPEAVRAELGLTEDDLEDVASFPRNVEGVLMGAMLRDLPDGKTKISLRTDSRFYNASEICGRLGGGGHIAASGATVDAPLSAASRILQETICAVTGLTL